MCQNFKIFIPKNVISNFQCHIYEYNICASVLLILFNLMGKGDKLLNKPNILSLFLNSFNKFNNTGISCKNLYVFCLHSVLTWSIKHH